MRRLVPVALALSALAPSFASAQQPLRSFLSSASERSLDVREAQAALAAASSLVDEARARLLPSALGTASYQRNDPVVSLTIPTGMVDEMGVPITRQADITPANQLSATGTATVPLIDLASWAGFFQSEATASAADASYDLVQENVEIAVVQLWHQLVAQHALVRSAERTLETARRNQAAAEARVQVGVSAQLELSRAQAESARARQTLAEARLGETLIARNLQNLTGLAPTNAEVALEDNLAAERPLATFTGHRNNLPIVRAAHEAERAAGIARDAAWLALLPTVSGVAVARYSNASGFGRQDTYYAGVAATWVLDFGRPARIGTTNAQLEGAHVRSERAEQQADTAIFEAWQRVESSRVTVEAAVVALEASRRAAADAQARFESGAGTQLDQIQAERDLFQAEVAHIQAIANLRVARAVLRIRSGMGFGG
jgi:outer membrane protein TolC